MRLQQMQLPSGRRLPAAPRTDPGVRNYRTGLLPRVFTREVTFAVLTLARQGNPALCPDLFRRRETPFGWVPSLHPLRGHRRADSSVRGLRRYYEPIRLPKIVHRSRTPCGFKART